MKTKLTAIVISMILLAPWIASAATIHVPVDQSTIQAGIDAAVNGDLVLVAPGTYVENIDFIGKAITVQSEGSVEGTIIDGGQIGSVLTFISGETRRTIIKGFTIRNGHGTTLPASDNSTGGGILCVMSHPKIMDCIVEANNASAGGGIYVESSLARIEGCTIRGNEAVVYGGGVYGSKSVLRVTNCTIEENGANWSGGGLCLLESFARISNCTISGNDASHIGGGVETIWSLSLIDRCTISGNTADVGGGSHHSHSTAWMENTLVSDNSCRHFGAGVYCRQAFLKAAFCTVAGNAVTHGLGEGGGFWSTDSSILWIEDSILWGDTASAGAEFALYDDAVAVVSHSDVQGGEGAVYVHPEVPGSYHWLFGNMDQDPLFVGGGDYHLTADSPCIDAGTDAGVDMDIDGEMRPQGAGFDIGADEFVSSHSCFIWLVM
ncbi:choice-of-anchor Q domain-containing protein [Thermodesulfobacteriota bacterium]